MLETRSQCVGILLMICCLLNLLGQAVAQDVPALTQQQQSVVVFDFRIDRLMDGLETLGVDTANLQNIPMEDIFEGVKPSEMKRLFGSLSLPEKLDELLTAEPGGELPIEVFVRIEFTNADACGKLVENVERGAKVVEAGGKKFWAPDGGFGPSNLVAHRVDDTNFEIGSLNYLLQPKRSFMTAGLKTAWKSAPDKAIRIAMDLERPAGFLRQAVEMAKAQSADPTVGAYLDLVDNIQSIVISADFKSDNLLTILANGNDDDEAEELQGGLDSLLGMAKMGGQMMLGQLTMDAPEATDTANQILESLKATREGSLVRIAIPKPDGFGKAIADMQAIAGEQAAAVNKMNNFRQLALSALNFESAYRKFPFDAEGLGKFSNDLSWRVRVLPFIEENEMYDQMKTDSGPDDPANAKMADKMPKFFGADGKNATVSWIRSEKPVGSFADILDGSSNTIMLVEYPEGLPWLENNSLTVDQAVELVSGLKDGETLVAVFYDGHVRRLTNKIDKETLRNLFDPTDGNSIDDF